MWTAAVLAVVAALTAIAWLGDDPFEHRGAICALRPSMGRRRKRPTKPRSLG
jgi:hypothetical protein